MSSSINKVILIGRLGKDPELEYTPSGAPVAKFSLATNQSFKDKSGETAEAYRVAQHHCPERACRDLGRYLTKGKPVYLEGRIRSRQWENQGGNKRTYVKPYLDGISKSEEVAWLVAEKS
jgi:single-strand DNA-binding protein